jgi:hypothetical protein
MERSAIRHILRDAIDGGLRCAPSALQTAEFLGGTNTPHSPLSAHLAPCPPRAEKLLA